MVMGVCAVGVIVLLLSFSADTAEGVRKGLTYACELLIPALFPFMVLSSFLIRSGLADSIGAWCGTFTRRWFRLPPSASGAILLSFIGGFPVGAKCVRLLYEQKTITAQQAEQMMLFCVGAGPAFLVTGIGTLLLHDTRAGVLLFVSQVLSGLLLGWLAGRLFGSRDQRSLKRQEKPSRGKVSWAEALIFSSSDGAHALIQMTALVALFGMLSALNERIGLCSLVESVLQWCGAEPALAEQAYYILTEVTAACQRMGAGGCPLWLIAMAVGFGGLCVHCQIWVLLGDLPLSKAKFLLFRGINAFMSSGIVYAASRFYQPAVMAAATGDTVQVEWGAMTATGTDALLLLSVLFVLSLRKT